MFCISAILVIRMYVFDFIYRVRMFIIHVLGVNFFTLFIVNNFLLLKFMDYIQMLIVHSRGVCNFLGMILGAQVSYFFAFMHSFQKSLSDFGHFQTLLQ